MHIYTYIHTHLCISLSLSLSHSLPLAHTHTHTHTLDIFIDICLHIYWTPADIGGNSTRASEPFRMQSQRQRSPQESAEVPHMYLSLTHTLSFFLSVYIFLYIYKQTAVAATVCRSVHTLSYFIHYHMYILWTAVAARECRGVHTLSYVYIIDSDHMSYIIICIYYGQRSRQESAEVPHIYLYLSIDRSIFLSI